jgi:hypothetical protein
MPGAPRLRLNFPRLSFPDLRLDGLTFGNLQPGLIDIGALLPPAGGGSSIRLSWTNQPKLAVSLVGGGVALPFGPGDGRFLIDRTEIVTLTGVTVATANGRYELKGDIVGTLANRLRARSQPSRVSTWAHACPYIWKLPVHPHP